MGENVSLKFEQNFSRPFWLQIGGRKGLIFNNSLLLDFFFYQNALTISLIKKNNNKFL